MTKRDLHLIQNDHRWKEKRISDHVIVHMPDAVDNTAFNTILKKHNAKIRESLHQISRFVLEVDNLNIMPLIKDLHDAGMIEDAEPNSLGGSSSVPNDPNIGQQWYLNDVHITDAWSLTTGSSNITLAVVDSGCYQHPDLTNVVAGWNYTTGNNNTTDTGASSGHGTAVSGCAAAVANNGIGIAGAAYNCSIMPVVVLNASDYASWSNVASATMYAADHGAKVINISIYGSSGSSTLSSAMTYAWNKGCVIFACAGNSATSALQYPAACPNVVSVAATDQSGNLASFSTFGSWVSIAAPGTPIYTTMGASGYGSWQGTSFSSPIAAGVAVLMISAYPAITNTQIVSILKSTVDPIANQSFGKINALKAVQLVQSTFAPKPVLPVLSIVATTTNATDSATNTTPFTFTVNRSGSLTGTSSVTYNVSGVASEFGGTLPSGTVSFSAGQSQATFIVNVAPNTVTSTQTFTVTLSNPVGATIGTASASATINPVPLPLPVLSISALTTSAVESATVPTAFGFVVNRTGDLSNASSVLYSVLGLSASVFGGTLPAGIVSFGVGQSQAIFSVSVVANAVTSNLSFNVSLSNPVGATIGTGITSAMIIALTPPVVSITPPGQLPAGSVANPFALTVQLTPSVTGTHTVTVTDSCNGWTGTNSITYSV